MENNLPPPPQKKNIYVFSYFGAQLTLLWELA
jgi:hypothetical protein